VQWREALWGHSLDLDHSLKCHVGEGGNVQLLLQKKLSGGWTLNWTSHLNLNQLQCRLRNMGVGVVYE